MGGRVRYRPYKNPEICCRRPENSPGTRTCLSRRAGARYCPDISHTRPLPPLRIAQLRVCVRSGHTANNQTHSPRVRPGAAPAGPFNPRSPHVRSVRYRAHRGGYTTMRRSIRPFVLAMVRWGAAVASLSLSTV